jgi:signal transduction histidine kinase
MPAPASNRPVGGVPHAVERASVWIVDDNQLQGEALLLALASEHDVRLFTSGAAMLERLAADGRPDLLLIDWYMPEMSGVDVCRFVRESMDGLVLPILVLTASDREEDLLEGIAAGANDFVRKPFAESELKARIAALLRTARLHAALAQTKNELQIEVEFRERFMGVLAHDLRQPLNTIIMATNALAGPSEPLVSEPGAKFVRMQQRAAERMVRMVTQLLDVTRIRPAAGMPIQQAPCDLSKIVSSTVDEMRIAYPKSRLHLSAETSIIGHWDADRLSQVCSNLIGNAIEHGSASMPIEIAVHRLNDEAQLSVVNRGDAIDPATLASLFQPFRRTRELNRATGGVGLGLHIVDQIVRAHGGSVEVQSDGRLTRFVVRLPCA